MAMQGNESSTCCPYERPADVLRDYIKEPEGSSFHLTLPISFSLTSPRALCWHWEANSEAAGCFFAAKKELKIDCMHNKIDIFLFLWRRLCPLNSAWSRTHFYVMFFSLGERREGQTVLSEMIWQEEMFSSFKKYWRLLIVELIKLLLSRSQSASAMIHPSICLISAMNPGCLVYLLVRNIQRNIWSSHLFSLSVGETLFMAGILCKDSSCCRCWQIWLSHTCQDAKQSQGTARTRSQSVRTQAGEIWSDFVSSVKYNLLMEKEAPIK